jgi:RNA polymerase sigma-70 factor, ECF subfamily
MSAARPPLTVLDSTAERSGAPASGRRATGFDDAWVSTRRELLEFIARRVEDLATAEDITQDVFMRLHRAHVEGAEIGSVHAWLYRVARNTIVDHYRTRRRLHPLPGDRQQAIDDEFDDAGPNRATRELAACLRPLVDQLPERYREAVILVELEGYTQVVAAAALGLSVSGTKSRVQRGRRQLRHLLTGCCDVGTDHAGAITHYIARADAPCDCSASR